MLKVGVSSYTHRTFICNAVYTSFRPKIMTTQCMCLSLEWNTHVQTSSSWRDREVSRKFQETEKQRVWLFDCKGKLHFTYSINCNPVKLICILKFVVEMWESGMTKKECVKHSYASNCHFLQEDFNLVRTEMLAHYIALLRCNQISYSRKHCRFWAKSSTFETCLAERWWRWY